MVLVSGSCIGDDLRLMNFRKVFATIAYRYILPKKMQCIICGKSCAYFISYKGGNRNLSRFIKMISLVGSDVENYECPWCGCNDRERHVFMYMMREGIFENFSTKNILHFAPEKRLAEKIMAFAPLRYVKCDLFPYSPDIIKVNVLKIPFKNESFDVLIANHVLEHVSDDIQALREISRVLKLNGLAILQTPFSNKLLHTWADPGIDTEEIRLEAYGQEDHVRLYGKDVFNRFAVFNLVPRIKKHGAFVSDMDPKRFAVNENEPFFLFEKRAPFLKAKDYPADFFLYENDISSRSFANKSPGVKKGLEGNTAVIANTSQDSAR